MKDEEIIIFDRDHNVLSRGDTVSIDGALSFEIEEIQCVAGQYMVGGRYGQFSPSICIKRKKRE